MELLLSIGSRGELRVELCPGRAELELDFMMFWNLANVDPGWLMMGGREWRPGGGNP